MRDFKTAKPVKVKGNRRRKEKTPIDWKKIFRVGLRLGVATASIGLAASAGLLVSRLIFASDLFRVETVRVENNARLTTEEVAALSDITIGSNIFELDLAAIGKKIEEEDWIAAARVERVFPREVVIRIRERQPQAIIHLGYLYYVDATGEVFKMLDPEDRLDFPVVTGIDRKFLLENPEAARRFLLEAVQLLAQLRGRSRFGLDQVSEVNVDAAEGYTLTTLNGGVPVRLGFSNFAGKLDRLEKIYPEIEEKLPDLKSIDLNVADRVIVRMDRKFTTGKG